MLLLPERYLRWNMDVVAQLNGALSVWTQILGVVILLVLYTLHCAAERGRDRQRHITCNSPNCVRCRAYTATSVSSLRQRWGGYTQRLHCGSENEAVKRITETLLRYMNSNGRGNVTEPPPFQLADLKTTPFHDRKSFSSDIELFQGNWEKIYKEYLQVENENLLWKVNSTPSGAWKAFYLINQGNEVTTNISRCPASYKILNELQNFMSGCIFGNACFSVVYPGTHIAEHYGPCNLRVRCHLGLDIPDECVLVVDGKRRRWATGKCLLFDDSYLHSVTHEGSDATSRPRVVFLVDFWNPTISQDERRGLEYLLHSDVILQDLAAS